MAILRKLTSWSKPRALRGPDLSAEERDRVRAALAVLHVRFGTLPALASQMGLKAATVKYAVNKRGGVSVGVALRTARAAGVPLESILSGAWPKPGMCPNCGRSAEHDDRRQP